MNLNLVKIGNFLTTSSNIIADRHLSGFWFCDMPEVEIELEDLQKAVIHLQDAYDVMKPLENADKVEIHDFT
ncbi:MAG: hypothetical protein WBA41_01185, partial [Rivularia sp. (in: cyanobacteria)]